MAGILGKHSSQFGPMVRNAEGGQEMHLQDAANANEQIFVRHNQLEQLKHEQGSKKGVIPDFALPNPSSQIADFAASSSGTMNASGAITEPGEKIKMKTQVLLGKDKQQH